MTHQIQSIATNIASARPAPLNALRALAVQAVLARYEFGKDIAKQDPDGWLHSAGTDEWSLAVSVHTNSPAGETLELVLVVVFFQDSDSVSEVYSRSSTGKIWGEGAQCLKAAD